MTVTFRLRAEDLAHLEAIRDALDARRQDLGQLVSVTRSDAVRWALREAAARL